MHCLKVSLTMAISILLVCSLPAQAVNIETVHVGNPGNTGELSGGSGKWEDGPAVIVGSVDYTYRIGKYEVTSGQYCDFLNAVGSADPYGLYNPEAWTHYQGCKIERIGSPGNYSYTVASDQANRPVTNVGWGDAARFANWMHNGQPEGILAGNPSQDAWLTEDGSYLLNGAITDAELLAVVRKDQATWAIPSEDEWYKAAYHKNNGVTGSYFDYPTNTDDVPSNILDGGGNNATFYDNGYTVGSPYWRTEVGAHINSKSPYGTFDQAGNVSEWTEAVFDWEGVPEGRGSRGGCLGSHNTYLSASFRDHSFPSNESLDIGFRVIYVPEPASLSLLTFLALLLLQKRSH